MGSVAIHEKKGACRMNDLEMELERELKSIKNKLRQAEKKAKDIKTAKDNEEGFTPKVTTRKTVVKELACGNCGEKFYCGEENSLWFLKEDNLPDFCSCCGGRIKKGGIERGFEE